MSLSAHLAAGLGLYAAGIWKIERVEAAHASTDIRPPFPVAAPEGGGKIVAQKQEVEQKKVAHDVTQPVPTREKAHPQPEAKDTPDTPGDGSGSGVGPGSGSGDPHSTGECIGDGCVKIPTPPDPPKLPDPPKPTKPRLVAQSQLPQFVSGERDVQPPETVITSMSRDGKSKTQGILLMCLDTSGHVSSVTLRHSTGYDIYDERLETAVRNWQYRPFMVDGKPEPVCSVINFQFTIR